MIGVDPRVTGAQRYAIDVERAGMLHAAFVRSPHAHARVKSIDVAAVPAGCVVLVGADVADLGPYGCQARDQRVLADRARHAGDVVAAVAARYAERIEPLSDSRGSAAYRRRVIAAEVRRAVEAVA